VIHPSTHSGLTDSWT